ncbi:MAG: hypothetical protein AB7S56_09195 [Halothiobacillaceae bacterium]
MSSPFLVKPLWEAVSTGDRLRRSRAPLTKGGKVDALRLSALLCCTVFASAAKQSKATTNAAWIATAFDLAMTALNDVFEQNKAPHNKAGLFE